MKSIKIKLLRDTDIGKKGEIVNCEAKGAKSIIDTNAAEYVDKKLQEKRELRKKMEVTREEALKVNKELRELRKPIGDTDNKILSIPYQLRQKKYRFIKTYPYSKKTRDMCLKKLKKSKITEEEKKKILALYNKPKRPLETGWQKENNYRWDEPEFQKYLKDDATGYGWATGFGDIAIVDSDHPAIKKLMSEQMPETLTTRTGGGEGHYHFPFECKLKDKIVLKNDDKGNHYGEVQWQGQQVIGPGSIHPSGKKYTIVRDRPVAKVTRRQLITALKPYLTVKDLTRYFHKKGEKIIEDETPHEKISIKPLLKHIEGLNQQGDEYAGSHPVHGSTTGRNFSINVKKNSWHCFRCNAGSGAIALVAILEKIISCEDVKNLTGKKLRKAEKIAVKKYGLKIKRRLREGIGTAIQLDYKTMVLLTDKGIFLDLLSQSGKWRKKKIYIGQFEPKEKLIVDDETAIRYISNNRERINNYVGIISTMKKEGGIVSKNDIENCVNAVCTKLPTKTGHATYGVYNNGGKITLCLDSLPLKDAQQAVKMQSKDAITQEITKDTIQPYIELIEHWHQYEMLPSMGMGIMATFALTLRKRHCFIYNILHFSPLPKLGKSTVQHIHSQYLFNISPISGNSIETAFRFSAVLDSICGYIPIDEAGNVKWRKTDDLLKSAPENSICNMRGRPDQGVNMFLSRGVLGLNCNRFGITEESTLVRILKIEFDGTLVAQRGGNPEKVAELKQIMSKLKPIGWRLVELELEDLNYSFEELERRLNHHEKELNAKYETFIDPRRVMTYAAIYEGLKVWERAADKYGIKWKTPSYKEFADNVIDKIEKTTEEAGELLLYDFIHWWEIWRVKNTRKTYSEGTSYDEIAGEDVIWKKYEIKPKYIDKERNRKETGKRLQGCLITKSIMYSYKKDQGAKIDSLRDIANAIGQLTGIRKEDLYRQLRVGGGVQWTVFIPSDIWKYKDGQTKLSDGQIKLGTGITQVQKEMKEYIGIGKHAGYVIDDEYLHKKFDAETIYDALESGLLIKNDDKEYVWRD